MPVRKSTGFHGSMAVHKQDNSLESAVFHCAYSGEKYVHPSILNYEPGKPWSAAAGCRLG